MPTANNIAFITLGCAKNEVDSDKMRALLRAAGYAIVDDPEQADLTVINTCGFLASAVEEGLDTIFAALGVADAPNIPVNKVLVTVGEILGSQRAVEAGGLRDEAGPRAYVKISDGCDRFCSKVRT